MSGSRTGRLEHYRRFVHEVGGRPSAKGARNSEKVLEKEEEKGLAAGGMNRLLLRTRHFTASGVIGSQESVSRCYKRFQTYFVCRYEERPRPIAGLDGIYSVKRPSATGQEGRGHGLGRIRRLSAS